MELGAKGPDRGHTGEARRQDKADRGSRGQMYSFVFLFFLFLSFFFFFFFFFGGGKGTGWKGDRKTKSERKKKNKHDSSHPLPPLAPGLSR